MAYAITQTCCNDASCVSVCPVNCIHPTPDEPDFGSTEMLYIDPGSCIDCGACADACPVDAIFPVDTLTGSLSVYSELNASFYAEREPASRVTPAPNFHHWGPPVFDREIPSDFEPLEVAVVGTGPAGMYAVEDLLLHTNSRVTLIDRLPTAGGLVRYGVAPDHPSTKRISETFERFHNHPRLRMRLVTEVGKDISVEELNKRYDAVIYAVGAASARQLGIPGEELDGSIAARTVVAWYNGHPEVDVDAIDLSCPRVALVGNGNVALDVARILTTDPDQLEDTPISRAALARLRESKVREVVVLARRGPDAAAYTTPELLALKERAEVPLVVDGHDEQTAAAIERAQPGEKAALLAGLTREPIDWSAPPPDDRRRIVLRFNSEPREILGDQTVRALRVSDEQGETELPLGQVIRAIGYRGTAVTGLPFDERAGTIPNSAGRVEGAGDVEHVSGNYVVGWIKRGPSGGIGANRECARETVGTLLSDAIDGRLVRRPRGFARKLLSRLR